MDQKYYQEELQRLRELAVEFAQAHPALAPMLSGASQDPDVERLLEGTAFMTGMLREKLDDDFPEIIQGLMQLTFPHYLQPIPAATMMAFTPKPNLAQSFTVSSGSAIDSVPVNGKPCRFRTCADVTVHPLRITDAGIETKTGFNPVLRIGFQLFGLSLADWRPGRLRLHFPGAVEKAADLYTLLDRHTVGIRFVPKEANRAIELPPGFLKNVMFDDHVTLMPYPGRSLPIYRLIQEYFILPEQFLFLDVLGWDQWVDRGSGDRFAIEFELRDNAALPRKVKAEDIALFVVPAINLFEHEAVPILLDHRRNEYRLDPAGKDREHYSIFSVENVRGILQGSVKKKAYQPFEHFQEPSGETGSYVLHRRATGSNTPPEIFIGLGYPEESPITTETLSIDLLCTNGVQPAALQAGDICKPTSTSPELCTFRNIRYPTKIAHPPLDRNLLWNLLSHMAINLLSITDAGNLRTLLRLYVFTAMQDQGVVQANLKRIEGIVSVSCEPGDRVYKGGVIRGFEIELRINPANFPSRGDFFLFAGMLDRFFSEYSVMNSYTRLTVVDDLSGERNQWPIRVGKKEIA